MASKNVKVTKNLEPTSEPGQHYRLLCMTGKNKGTSYYLISKRAVMGRGDKADIQVLDTKSSRAHAEIVKVGKRYVLTDLKSQNGVIVNDLKINQHQLKNGDKVIIGQTVYKYSEFKNKDLLKDEEEEEDDDYEEDEGSSKKGQKKKSPMLILILIAVVVMMFMGGDEQAPKNKKAKPKGQVGITAGEDLAKSQDGDLEPEIRRKLDMYLHRGIREYREGNYFRAIAEFDMALTLSPRNGRASFYKRKSTDKIQEVIDTLFIKAARDRSALKYNSAIIALCEIVKLLDRYPQEDIRKKAEQTIKDVLQEKGADISEGKCITE